MNVRLKKTAAVMFASATLFTSGLVAPTSAMAAGDCHVQAIQACELYFPQGLFGPRYATMEECYEGETEFRCGPDQPPPTFNVSPLVSTELE